MFRSHEAGRQDFVTILANHQPFQDPQGGPNFYMFNPHALYEIHVDNNGDAVEDLTFQFRFKNTSKAGALTVFLKGIEGINQPKNVVAGEMLRLNTSTPAFPAAVQNQLGLAGGDGAGFPNGRRPADDVVDLSLRVSMGALCALAGNADALKAGCKPSDAPAGGLALTDCVATAPGPAQPPSSATS